MSMYVYICLYIVAMWNTIAQILWNLCVFRHISTSVNICFDRQMDCRSARGPKFGLLRTNEWWKNLGQRSFDAATPLPFAQTGDLRAALRSLADAHVLVDFCKRMPMLHDLLRPYLTNRDKSDVRLVGTGLLEIRDLQVSVVSEKAAFLQSLCKSTGTVVSVVHLPQKNMGHSARCLDPGILWWQPHEH